MPPPAKRRKTEPAIEEITFDLAARQEFLTGFHKRKVQRAKHAQEKAEQRARQDRIEERRKLREERKEELERHVKTVNEMLKPAGLEVESDSDNGEESGAEEEAWQGIGDVQPEPVDHEAEYIDEDKYTTVTVETMDVTKDGLLKAEQSNDAKQSSAIKDKDIDVNPRSRVSSSKHSRNKDRPHDKPKRPKKRNFKYEGRTERKVSRAKEKLRNRKQAQARKAG